MLSMVVKQHHTFKLERGTRQGDPISAHLFIIDLEVVFSLIKASPDFKDQNVLHILSDTLLMQMTLQLK